MLQELVERNKLAANGAASVGAVRLMCSCVLEEQVCREGVRFLLADTFKVELEPSGFYDLTNCSFKLKIHVED